MATVTIENAEVFRLIPGYGFKLLETKKLRNGDTAKNYFTVWCKEQVKEGDIVTVEGELTVKLEEFTGKDGVPRKAAAVHVNNALVMIQGEELPF